MSAELAVRNCQRTIRLNLRSLREITQHLLEKEFGLADYELGVQFVSERRMAEVNWRFLQHEGPTDVITFNHAGAVATALHGELFICPVIAKTQAKEFQSSLQLELVRYLVHGVLHLRGFDDLSAAARKVMKREEGRLLRRLTRHFRLSQVRKAHR